MFQMYYFEFNLVTTFKKNLIDNVE